MATIPPLRGEKVIDADGSLTQKFAEYVEDLETTEQVSEQVDNSSTVVNGSFAQSGSFDKRIQELEETFSVFSGLFAQNGNFDKRIEELEMNKNVIQLGQLRPINTTAISIYSPNVNESTKIKEIIVCNTTAISADYRIFHDEDGTIFDETTALFFDVALAGNSTDVIELNTGIENSSGNIAVRTDTNDALTFTLSGEVTPK